MSVPLTTRLSEEVVAALEREVAAGRAPSKGAIVAEAVQAWLERRSEEGIAASYQRAYADPDPDHDAVVEKLSAYSAGVILDRDR